MTNDKQVGGEHYKLPIQPIDYIVKNGLGYREGNVIKYVTRHKTKNGAEDIRKAIHYLEMILEEYNEREQTVEPTEECHHMQDSPEWGQVQPHEAIALDDRGGLEDLSDSEGGYRERLSPRFQSTNRWAVLQR